MTREEAIQALKKEKRTALHENKSAFDMAIKALEQEPCEDCISNKWWSIEDVSKCLEKNGFLIRQSEYDLISRADVLEIISDINDTVFGQVVSREVEKLPSIQPKPKTGHWIKLNVGYGCSECSLATNKSGRDFYRFCPNCGAKMESEDKE